MGPQSKDRGKTSPAIMCIKVFLHAFNFLYLVIGVCVLAIGIWVQVQLKDYMQLTGLYYVNTAYIMIGVGILIMLVAFGGFFCTAKDKIALLYMYGIFITLLAIMQIGAGIAGGVVAKNLDSTNTIETELFTSMESHAKDMKYWDKVQKTLKCCGVLNATDWLEEKYGGEIPDSCYLSGKAPDTPDTPTTPTITTSKPTPHVKPSSTTEAPAPTARNVTTTIPDTTSNASDVSTTTAAITTSETIISSAGDISGASSGSNSGAGSEPIFRKRRDAVEEPFHDGCYNEIKMKFKEYLAVIVGICIGFVLLQLMGAVLACCLAKRTSRNNYEQIY